MSDSLKVGFVVVFMIFILSLIGSVFTLMSINVLFDLDIPVTIETILSLTWLTMCLKGIFSPSIYTGKSK
jgi:hypothetical protein